VTASEQGFTQVGADTSRAPRQDSAHLTRIHDPARSEAQD
jgi:hypothetical protein